MALLSALVKAIADVEGIDEMQVGWVARHLREAGLITQAGRGRGAAHMTCTDAAHLLIGVNAASTAKEAVAAVQNFGSLVCSWSKVRGGERLASVFSKGIGFSESLSSLISAAQPLHGYPSDLAWEIVINTDYLGGKYLGNLADNIARLSPHINEIVSSEIVFHRPAMAVSISVIDNHWRDLPGPSAPPPFDFSERAERMIVDAAFTGQLQAMTNRGDKEDSSKISLKTIFEIARALNS